MTNNSLNTMETIIDCFRIQGIMLDIVVYDSDGEILKRKLTDGPELRWGNLHGSFWDEFLYIKKIRKKDEVIDLVTLENESDKKRLSPSYLLKHEKGYFLLNTTEDDENMSDEVLLNHYIGYINKKLKS